MFGSGSVARIPFLEGTRFEGEHGGVFCRNCRRHDYPEDRQDLHKPFKRLTDPPLLPRRLSEDESNLSVRTILLRARYSAQTSVRMSLSKLSCSILLRLRPLPPVRRRGRPGAT
jgi:hypothetical protein